MLMKKMITESCALIFALTLGAPIFAFASVETDTKNSTPKRIQLEDVQRFSNAIGEIKKYYVKPINDKVLFDNAIRGMLQGLDPHSSYLSEDEFKELQASTSGEFGGLGIEVTMEDGIVKVITPLVDTPAYKAGIQTGDYIVKLGDKSVQGLSLKEAVNLMRGKPGTTIELTVFRKLTEKPLVFNLVREQIIVKSVKAEMLRDGYGYIRLTQFQAMTDKDMLQAIEQLKQQSSTGQLKGLILDLRNNPGGLLDSAIQVSDAFLNNQKSDKPKMIVYTEGRLPGSKFVAFAHAHDVLNNAPMVVLINNGSASASEIVAGALKDNHRALILGTKSFGKGSVQTVLPLDNKTGIKLTTALYYTPSGTSIQAQGIMPDIVLEDVAVSKEEAKKNVLAGYTEASLNNHLLNNNKETPTFTKTKQAEKDNDLIHKDYQLYAALTVLEGMALAR